MSTVFTGSGDARARAFDAQSGALRRVFRGHAFVINCIQVGAPPRPGPAAGWQWLVARPRKGRAEGPPTPHPGQPRAPAGRASPAEAAQGCAGRVRARPEPRGAGWGRRGFPPLAAHAPRPQVHGQVLYTASHDGALRLWDVRGLRRCAPPPPSAALRDLQQQGVGCAAAPLPPA